MISQENLSYGVLCRTKSRQELDAIQFNPNQLVGTPSSFCNPMINALIACEDYITAIKIIKMYSDILDPNQKDGEQKSALIIAAKMFNAEEVALVLLETFQNRIDVNAQDENGWSALHYAFAFRNSKLAKKLLDDGADRSLLNKDNKAPMQCLEMESKEIEELLSSIDIEPTRDIKAKGNKLDWHFRFLYMEQTFSHDTRDLLSLPTTHENMKTLQRHVASDVFTATNKEAWLTAISLQENQLQGNTVIASIMDKRFPLEDLRSQVKELGVPTKGLLSQFTNFVLQHPYITIAGLVTVSGLTKLYFSNRSKP